MNTETKTCQNCKQPFVLEPDDFAIHEKMKVPPPTFCPDCRMRRRFAWRNEHNLYRRKDARTGEEVFSSFAPSVSAQVYEKEYWNSDAWDALSYGRDYDFSRPFFEQFREFMQQVPWPSRSVIRITNSDYCDQAGDLKNCYLCFNSDYIEDSGYIVRSVKIKNCFDLLQSHQDELSYEGVALENCYRTFFSRDCESCNDVWFSERCIGCTNCFGCANLRNRSYCFLGEQLTKEEYEARIKALRLDSWSGLTVAREKAAAYVKTLPVKYFHGIRAVESSGDYLKNVKNVKRSFFVEDAQDVKYSQNIYLAGKDLYDYSVWGAGATLMYECTTCGEADYGCKFCCECWPACKNLEYSLFCRSTTDSFACISLRKKQYCIFNKQYSKEEYYALREKIVKQMSEIFFKDAAGRTYGYGEFFPEELSPFAYNETMLQGAYPLTREEALEKGHRWYDPERREYQTTKTAAGLPDSINDVTDEILKEIIECDSCKKAYRIIQPELGFLKKEGIPLPRQCVNCRLASRFTRLNKPNYYHRACACRELDGKHFHGSAACPNEFETAYAPDRPEVVYCEQCYNAETA